MSQSVVPIIDIEPYRIGDTAAKQRVAEQVERACRDIGFLTIVGHGVPDTLTTHCYDLAKQFFTCPPRKNRPLPGRGPTRYAAIAASRARACPTRWATRHHQT